MTTPRTPATIPKAAELTQIGERTIRRWITARLLTCYKTEKGVRVVIIQEVIAVDRLVRQDILRSGRARLRRDYLKALAETRKPDGSPPA